MALNWYPKQKPLQGVTGLWGGAAGSLMAGTSGPEPGPGGEYGFELWGGGGGGGAYKGGGGSGGYWKGTIVLPAGVYYITAGQQGFNSSEAGARQRGAGGPGLRQNGSNEGGSGGGFSAIWDNSSYTGNPIALVAGGGRSDWWDLGGNGGGIGGDGGKGYDNSNPAYQSGENNAPGRPNGATLTAGGSYSHANSKPTSTPCNGEAGVQLRGGDAECNDTWGGGAGGGGYWGGGAGTGNNGSGGTPGSGGSGYQNGSYTFNTQVNTPSGGQRSQNYNPNTGSMYYQTSHPGTYGGGGYKNNDGGGGHVKIWNSSFNSTLHEYSADTENEAVGL